MEPLNHRDRGSEIRGQVTRRDVLTTAAGLGLSLMLPGMDLPAAEKRGKERSKSLITLWLAGGPSQLETWDPHAGTKMGVPTKAISITSGPRPNASKICAP